ncbi:hypothetical protein BC628DRAFT_1362673 [Trametes gibbosa]|nr:hypothetical protein BC628DRAFT_1362673 [Trametes gibbosa]
MWSRSPVAQSTRSHSHGPREHTQRSAGCPGLRPTLARQPKLCFRRRPACSYYRRLKPINLGSRSSPNTTGC